MAAEMTALKPAFQASFSLCGRAPEKRCSSRANTSALAASSSDFGTKPSLPPQGALTALSVKILVSMSDG